MILSMKNETLKKTNKKTFWVIMAALLAVIVALNILAWSSEDFCTWYADNVTIIWVNIYSRITNICPISVGEIMLTMAVILVAALVILSVILIFLRKRTAYRKFYMHYLKSCIAIAMTAGLIMTLNCSLIYHAESLDANPGVETRQYTVDELKLLRNYIIEKCNEYSSLVERDSDGYAVYDGDMQATASEAMNGISDIYPRLAGYYPNVKTMMYSSLMCQMYMTGYFFPFSMEANANGLMYIVNWPATYCHELSHLHGYIYEDEANFLAFLACINSDDDFFRYAGYMSVLNYVYNAYANYIDDYEEYALLPQTNDLVDTDNIFLTEDTWHKVEESSVLDTETVDEISDSLTNASLKANGVSDGMASYSRVVGLLLEYYDGILY